MAFHQEFFQGFLCRFCRILPALFSSLILRVSFWYSLKVKQFLQEFLPILLYQFISYLLLAFFQDITSGNNFEIDLEILTRLLYRYFWIVLLESVKNSSRDSIRDSPPGYLQRGFVHLFPTIYFFMDFFRHFVFQDFSDYLRVSFINPSLV